MHSENEESEIEIIHELDVPKWRDTVSKVMKRNEDAFDPTFSEREGSLEKQVDNYVNPKKELLRAVKNRETVGILIFVRGGDREPIEKYCPCIYINLIIVDREYRNKGIGSQLYRYMTSEIFPNSEYETMGVRTWEENTASQKCIEKAGFEEKAQEEGDYNRLHYYVLQE